MAGMAGLAGAAQAQALQVGAGCKKPRAEVGSAFTPSPGFPVSL